VVEGMGVEVLLVDFHGVLVPKGWLADEEFVDKDSEGPPVYCCAVACFWSVTLGAFVSVSLTCIPDDFWRKVLWCAA
jgi:hypothetical protein